MRLDQIEHATSNLPQHREVTALEDEARTLDTQLVNSRTALSDVQREVDKSEADVQLVRDRAARDRARLDAGTGTAKDLQALQHELTSLSRRQSELEDIELEIMERAEALAEHVTVLERDQRDLATRLAAVVEARDLAMGDYAGERDTVAGRRAATVESVGEDLVALYETALKRRRRGNVIRLYLTAINRFAIALSQPLNQAFAGAGRAVVALAGDKRAPLDLVNHCFVLGKRTLCEVEALAREATRRIAYFNADTQTQHCAGVHRRRSCLTVNGDAQRDQNETNKAHTF